jgi:hypothetical protein
VPPLHPNLKSPIVDRREFVRIGGGLAASSFLAPAACASLPRPSSARSCILIYLLGGPPHLDTFDLKPNAPAEVGGPFKPIPTSVPGVQICEHLPRLARLAHRYSLVRSVSHNNHNHTPMIYYTLTGRPVDRPGEDNDVRPPQRADFPHLGAVLAHFRDSPRGLPGYVAIPELAVRSSTTGEFKRSRTSLRGGGAGFLGPRLEPLCVNGDPGTAEGVPALATPADVSAGRQDRRAALLSVLEQRGPAVRQSDGFRELRDQAVALTGASGGAAPSFTVDGEPTRLRDRYGSDRFGRSLLLARRLAEASVPMTAIHFNEMTVCDGWDTHSKNFEALKGELLPIIDRGISALLEDLHDRGMLDQTLVVVMGEFGRTPRINAAAGRDHWGSCQSVLLAGGGIRAGRVVGCSDKIGAYPITDPVDPTDIHATIYHLMGLDPEQLIHDHLRRPYPICIGRPLSALV